MLLHLTCTLSWFFCFPIFFSLFEDFLLALPTIMTLKLGRPGDQCEVCQLPPISIPMMHLGTNHHQVGPWGHQTN